MGRITAASYFQNALIQAYSTMPMHSLVYTHCVVFSELAVEVGPQRE